MNHNQISDISPVSNLINLTQLEIENNQVRDISPVSNLRNLKLLNIRDNPISDLSPVLKLNSLKYFWLTNPTDSISLLGLKKNKDLDMRGM